MAQRLQKSWEHGTGPWAPAGCRQQVEIEQATIRHGSICWAWVPCSMPGKIGHCWQSLNPGCFMVFLSVWAPKWKKDSPETSFVSVSLAGSFALSEPLSGMDLMVVA